MQVGDILKFGLDHMPFVRGVHFQLSVILADVPRSAPKSHHHTKDAEAY